MTDNSACAPPPRLDIHYVTHGRQKVGRNFEHAKHIPFVSEPMLEFLSAVLFWVVETHKRPVLAGIPR